MYLIKSIILLFLISFTLNAKELEKVSIQLQWLDQFQFAGYYMAKEKGFYEDIGLDVEIKKFKYNINVVDTVMKQEATYGIGRSSLIIKKSNGIDLKLLSAIFQSSPSVFISKAESNINHIEDFKNKTIMMTSDVAYTVSLRAMLVQNNLSLEDVKILNHTFDIDDLINNKVDIIASYISNEPYFFKKRGIEINIFDPKEYGFDFYSDILFTSNKEILTHKQRALNFNQASLKGWKYAFEHINESVDLILKKYNIQNKTKEALIFEAKELKKLLYYKTKNLGHLELQKLQRIYDLYNVMALIKNKLQVSDLIVKSNKNKISLTQKEKEYLEKKKVITMCVIPDVMPYSKIKDDKYIGMGADIIELISKKIDTDFVLVPTKSWAKSLEYAKQRKCDILPVAAKTPSREKYLNFTKGILHAPLVIATRNDEIYIPDITNILDKKLGVSKGHSYIEMLKLSYPNINLIEVKNNHDGLKKVTDRELYAMIGDLASMAYEIQRSNTNNLKISGSIGKEISTGIGVRNDDDELFSILNKAINAITEEDMQDIYSQWVSVKYEKATDYTLAWEITIFLIIFIIFGLYRQNELNKYNQKLKDTQKKLQVLNNTLEIRIKEEVDNNRIKDQQILHKSRLAQIGEMISMIAHQWRQPLSAISSTAIDMRLNIELGIFDIKKESDRELCFSYFLDSLRNIDIYVKSLTSTIDDFRNFYKPNKDSVIESIKQPISISLGIVKQIYIANNIEIIEKKYVNKHIQMYSNELIQVFLNIFKNAQDNFSEKKQKDAKIIISTTNSENGIIVEISDNGGGIDENIIDRIFDPYFSTKDKQNGTGLGLYMSKMIIEEHHNGKLSISNIDNGCCVRLELNEIIKEEGI